MTALRLRSLLASSGIEVKALAAHCAMPRSSASKLVNQARWPKRRSAAELRQSITAFLQSHGLPTADWHRREKAATRVNAPRPVVPPTANIDEENTAMVLRRQHLTEATRKHFGICRDPFIDPREPDDVFLSPDIRYIREAMLGAVKHGGFLAVVGESGAGKSTLREELIERIERDLQGCLVIQPYVLAMEDNDSKGKTLKSLHIAEAIMATLKPLTGLKSSPEARFRQLHETLRESSRTGNRHVLIIEEAHSIPIPTLKHLKRFVELKDGLRPLLSIILLGQPELATKLSEQNPEVREVVQRIEITHLAPLDNQLEAYLRFRLQRAGVDLAAVMEPGAVDAIRAALSGARARGSLLYPLAVQNLTAACLNEAARLGAPRVTADLVRIS